jgi:CubicO group peptidase (beta-lactamase class C family)
MNKTVKAISSSLVSALLIPLLFMVACKNEENDERFPLAEEHNIDEGMLVQAFDHIQQVEGIASLVVCRDGVIVAEDYYNGYRSDSIKTVMSVTKTVTSLLIGLALEKGYIDDINDPISKYLTGIVIFPDTVKASITLRQMLMMTFGHAWNGTKPESLYETYAATPDHLQYIIDLPLVYTPGTVFNYSDGASHLLSVIITEATGINTLDFAMEYLFLPLGISDISWGKDDRGYPNGAASLRISPHDMVKIGNLILNGGRHNGVQVVPESWITAMTTTQISTNNDVPYGPEYGYQIWINSSAVHKYYFAMGWGGQFIFMVPDQNLVVTASCQTADLTWQQAGEHWTSIIQIIVNDVFGAVH